jgi:hypothetical protein
VSSATFLGMSRTLICMCISRMGKKSSNSKVTHSVRNSCSPLSDAEPPVVDSESDDEESSHCGSKAGSPHLKLKADAQAQKLSEPKRIGAKCFKGESHDSLSIVDELKRSYFDRLMQQATEDTERKFDIAKRIQVMDELSDELKAEIYQMIFQ